MNIGNTIKLIRQARGIKQKDLAKAVGLTSTRLSYIETERAKVTPKRMVLIARKLDIDVEVLLLLSVDPKLTKSRKNKEMGKTIIRPIIEYFADGTL